MSANPQLERPELSSANDASVTPVSASPPSQVDSRRLRDAFGAFATGVTIVTINTPTGPQGMTVNSFSSVSLDPPLVLWSVANHSARRHLFAQADYFAINVLSEKQTAMALAFAKNGSVFDSYSWQCTEFNSPVLAGCVASFECCANTCHAGGDHTIVVGEVLRATLNTGNPLIFHRGKFRTIQPRKDE